MPYSTYTKLNSMSNLNEKKPNNSYLRPFGCKCFIHNNGKENLGKFDARSDEGIFFSVFIK